jgi:hypothetical protein
VIVLLVELEQARPVSKILAGRHLEVRNGLHEYKRKETRETKRH